MSSTSENAEIEALFDSADRRHHLRRRRTARLYRLVTGVFFAGLLVLAILVMAKFATSVLPEYFH